MGGMPEKDVDRWYAQQSLAKLVGTGGIEIVSEEQPKIDTCPVCERKSDDIKRRRRYSAYANEEENWLTSCQDCYDTDYSHLRDDWEEYYSMVM